jgi:hypothetical protein
MTLPRCLLEHKTLLLAVLLIARRIQQLLELQPGASASELARQLGAHRTSAYEQARRVLTVLGELATASPGRPPKAAPSAEESMRHLELRNAVLEYRVAHPGAWVEGPRGRTEYSPELKRFLLSRREAWGGTLESFARATGVPLDTLRDWLAKDSLDQLAAEAQAEQAKVALHVPVDASWTVRRIVEHYEGWQGSLRSFLRHGHHDLGISCAQLVRVMRILCEIRQRRTRPAYRYRGETRRLVPGLVLVTDGTPIDVFLTGSGRRLQLSWQGMVDQATGCHTPARPVVTPTEDAASVLAAYDQSLVTLAGVLPEALLHDGKSCYQQAELVESLAKNQTQLLPATPGRPQNKAICEGSFGLFEQRVGPLTLDDSSTQTLILSAVSEVLRVYTAASNGIPREELEGQSPLAALRRQVPSKEQLEADRAYLRKLTQRHRERLPAPDEPVRRALLDEGYQRLGLLDNDPHARQRKWLAGFCTCEAIRRGLALVAARIERLDPEYAHRYLAQVIQNIQDEIDLERAALELDHLCRAEGKNWMARYQQQLDHLRVERPEPDRLAVAIAEKAAQAEIPLGGVFWTRQLLDFLDHARHLLATVRQHLIRLFEEPLDRRLSLLDTLAAWEHGLRQQEPSC